MQLGCCCIRKRSRSLSLNPSLEVREGTVLSEGLDVDTITLDLTAGLEALEIGVNVLGESVFTGDEDLLAARELELGATEGLLSVLDVLPLCADGDQDGANVDTSRLTESLAVSVAHTGLESISTGAREHLVDADDVPRVDSDSNVETFFTCVDLHVLVSSNTGSLEGLGGDLLLLVRDHMDAGGEHIPVALLLSTVVHSDLGIRHTTVEAGLGVRLVFLVSIAPRGSSSHLVN